MPIYVLHLWLAFAWKTATKNKLRLRIGAYYLKRGAGVAVGQPIKRPATKHQDKRVRFVDNLYFNFKSNSITHTLSQYPVKGFSEQFVTKKKKKKAA